MDVNAPVGQPCHLNTKQVEESVVSVIVVVAVDGGLDFLLVSSPFKIIRFIIVGIPVDGIP